MTIAEKILDWALVAFYPGPIEGKEFAAGYMKAVHEVESLVQRLIDENKEEPL